MYFLHKIGINQTEDTDYNDKFNKRLLGRKINEAIMRAKASWIECAKNDPDHLTLDEFLSFMHPESSYSMIISVVDEIYKKFGEKTVSFTLTSPALKKKNKIFIFFITKLPPISDRDGDEILTEDEFSTLQSEEGEFEKPQPGNQEERERRKEFREMVDLNKDGKATRREVLVRRGIYFKFIFKKLNIHQIKRLNTSLSFTTPR